MFVEASDVFWIVLLMSIAFSFGRFFPVESTTERIVQERIREEEHYRAVVGIRMTTELLKTISVDQSFIDPRLTYYLFRTGESNPFHSLQN
mgnify:CR=1 FL=1